jgi:NADH-quinone oxidoreductase subunit L
MDFVIEHSYLIPLLPLIGAAAAGFFGARHLRENSHWPIWLGVGASALLSFVLLFGMLARWGEVSHGEAHAGPAAHAGAEEEQQQKLYSSPTLQFRRVLYTWIRAGEREERQVDASGRVVFDDAGREVTRRAPAFVADAAFFYDPLTAVMLCVICGIGFLITVFAKGYMAGEEGYFRFFAYLGLFVFMMTILVMGDNQITIYLGWEGVGLCSYLLIGYYYERPAAREAAKKAFLVNRVGDFGFGLGIMLCFLAFGTVSYFGNPALAGDGLLEKAALAVTDPSGGHDLGGFRQIALAWIPYLLMLGAFGKSAQFPLYVWLPDAMEGPTPVSALIHAATMVNAGVYLVARTNPIFASAPDAMVVVAAIGIFTAILAASIAMTQTDIKRVLAYSTLSQLGYMFASLGVGAFTAAIFHLMTHGFFKGLLFLGSGSVIHAVHEEQDMRRMGGLAKKIPHTYRTMLIGSIAIAGIPPLAGFFSKDEILGEAFKNGFQWVWAIGIVVAIMTAFYMFRLIGLTFWGESRVDPKVEPQIHESPSVMTTPLWVLAVPSLLLGLVLTWGGPPLFTGTGLLAGWLHPVFEQGHVIIEELTGRTEPAFALFGVDGALILASVAVAVIGVLAAWRLFGVNLGALSWRPDPERVRSLTARVPFLYRASLNKWWFDDLNHLLFMVIGGRIAAFLWWFDRRVVDDTVNDVATTTVGAGKELRRVQTGRVQNYALGIAVGLIVMAGSFLVLAAR